MKKPQQAITRQLTLLSLTVVAMFGFAVFVLPPLYEAFCEITGLNGKPRAEAAVASREADLSREITVEFVTSVDAQLPWGFEGNTVSMTVYPGRINQVQFRVVNRADTAITGRAIPSVAPAVGASHVKKTECFCFREQTLAAGASLDMPVIFYIDPDLPKSVKTLTLAYRFYRQPNKT